MLAPGSASAATPDDARNVVCLSGSGRQGVVDAASALGLVTAASTPAALDPSGGRTEALTLDAWRTARPDDFRRACAAHVEAQALTRGAPAASASGPGLLSWLLPLVVGALLTMGAAEIRSARDRGLANANGVRTATAAFRDAVSAYAAEWAETTVGARPSPVEVDTARRQLVAVLRRATAGRSRWRFAELLVTDLDSPRYRAELKDGWQADRTAGRVSDRGERVGTLLGALESDAERIAVAVEGLPSLRRSPMRKEAPASPLCPIR
ncbi:hypothetical protein ACIRSF_00660 [Streptomyces rubiginosohelvolus]|uniref:hypothetical protein n=1 Tax=Streptomyces rubiginosohelvolus TaxID=67362 RepID=UPI0037F50B7F